MTQHMLIMTRDDGTSISLTTIDDDYEYFYFTDDYNVLMEKLLRKVYFRISFFRHCWLWMCVLISPITLVLQVLPGGGVTYILTYATGGDSAMFMRNPTLIVVDNFTVTSGAVTPLRVAVGLVTLQGQSYSGAVYDTTTTGTRYAIIRMTLAWFSR